MMKRHTTLFCLFIAMAIFIACGKSEKGERDNTVGTNQPTDSLILVLEGQEGKSVLEVTLENHKVDYIKSIDGSFVNAIDSVEVGIKYGWMYSVNDSMGQVASDKYITHDGDTVKWHYRKFDN
nr:DUF4430 domain-containing protein [candidate division Zixibacteria bacterium]